MTKDATRIQRSTMGLGNITQHPEYLSVSTGIFDDLINKLLLLSWNLNGVTYFDLWENAINPAMIETMESENEQNPTLEQEGVSLYITCRSV